MTSRFSSDSYSNDAHRSRLDITDSYLALGNIPDLVGVSVENEGKPGHMTAVLYAVSSLSSRTATSFLHNLTSRYSGLRGWIKYIGVKVPSRPASAIATAQRFRVCDT